MNAAVSRSLAVAAMITVLVPAARAEAQGEKAKAKKPVIATLDRDAKTVKIRTEILKKKFPDGGTIEHFRIARREGAFLLIRVGKDVEGQTVTDAVGLETSQGGKLILGELKWIATCQATCSKDCPGGTSVTGFCVPDGSHCDCLAMCTSTETTVQDWTDEWPDDAVRDIFHQGVSSDCTFGTAGGGLYDVVLFGG